MTTLTKPITARDINYLVWKVAPADKRGFLYYWNEDMAGLENLVGTHIDNFYSKRLYVWITRAVKLAQENKYGTSRNIPIEEYIHYANKGTKTNALTDEEYLESKARVLDLLKEYNKNDRIINSIIRLLEKENN